MTLGLDGFQFAFGLNVITGPVAHKNQEVLGEAVSMFMRQGLSVATLDLFTLDTQQPAHLRDEAIRSILEHYPIVVPTQFENHSHLFLPILQKTGIPPVILTTWEMWKDAFSNYDNVLRHAHTALELKDGVLRVTKNRFGDQGQQCLWQEPLAKSPLTLRKTLWQHLLDD